MTETPSSPSVVINTAPGVQDRVPQGMAIFSNPGDAGGLQQRQTVDLGVSNEQVASIAVTRIEKAIRLKIGELRAQLEVLLKAQTTRVRDQNTILDTWCKTQTDDDQPRITALQEALKPFTGRPLTTSNGTASYNSRTHKLTAPATFESGDTTITYDYTADAPNSFIEGVKAIQEGQREIEDLQKNILQTKTALSNMDSIERSASASIAQSMLNRTEEGKRMVEAIEKASESGSVDEIIRQLSV